MPNKSDIKECWLYLCIAVLIALVFSMGWMLGQIKIADNCGNAPKTAPPTFKVFNDTFTCSRVGG